MQSQTAWLAWLEARCAQQPIQLGLTRVREVAAHLDVLTRAVPVITIAGTNGKGSTVKALATIYQAAGFQVATYTSPHVLVFNERICINQQPIEDEALCEAFQAVYAAEQASQKVLTYFEFTTLAALWHFKCKQPDVIILEVGLGGRLDATNIIDPDLAILTTIDFDHQAFLGHTLEEIGFEKAGIFRPKQLAIFASPNPPHSVIQRAKELQAQLKRYQHDYIDTVSDTYQFKSVDFEWKSKKPHLHHQAVSAAIMATRMLLEWLPVPEIAYEALVETTLVGRLQWVPGEVDMLVDVSHNPQSVRRLSDYLTTLTPKRQIHAIFSALKDKPVSEMIATLAQQVSVWHIAPLTGDRALSLAELRKSCSILPQQSILWYNDLNLAYDGTKARVGIGDMILVFGSFMTVAAILTIRLNQGDTL